MDYQIITDEELISGCVRGERKSQELLYKKFSPKMYSVCLGYSNNRDEAKDILQEGFIKVFSSIRNYKHDGLLGAWIRRIIVNVAIDYYRKNLKDKNNVDVTEAKNVFNDSDVLEKIDEKELVELIQKLPEGARLIFNLYVIEGYTHKEIAEKLGINEGTSKSQFSRAKALLQEWILKISKVEFIMKKAKSA